MKQSPLLEFESSQFTVIPGEDDETNPGIYGKSLAGWLAQQLQAHGVGAGEVIAEDFGWCVPVTSAPHSLYVACASEDDQTQKWRVFVFSEGGMFAKLLGKDKSGASVDELFATIKRILEPAPGISALVQSDT
jgi:hypothetical protein